MNKKIAIIGNGHMGNALIQGLLNSGFTNDQLLVSNTSQENRKAVEEADWIFITVKPHIAKTVLEEIKDVIADKIIISAAAGLQLQRITSLTTEKQKIIRIMPNIPVAYNEGVVGFFANQHVTPTEKKEILAMLSDLGTVIKCTEEEALETITILAGCGPALVAYLINLIATSGESFGLSKNTSEIIAFETFSATLKLLQETDQTPKELQAAVATKGGITEEIIKDLNAKQFPEQFVESLEKGYTKIKKLNEEL